MIDLIVWALAIGAALCIALGFGLGSMGLTASMRRSQRLAADLRETSGALAQSQEERARLQSQRDDALGQLRRAETALAEVTHPVQHSADLPQVDAPRGAHHRPDPEPCRSLITDPFYAGGRSCELYCEHDDGEGHTGRHTAYDGDVEWDDDGEVRHA